jgi:hypothetical protein
MIPPEDSELRSNSTIIDWSSIKQAAESVLSACFAPTARNLYLQGETTIMLRRIAHHDSSDSQSISQIGSLRSLIPRAQKKTKKNGKAVGAGARAEKEGGKAGRECEEETTHHNTKVHIKICNRVEGMKVGRAEEAKGIREKGKSAIGRIVIATALPS